MTDARIYRDARKNIIRVALPDSMGVVGPTSQGDVVTLQAAADEAAATGKRLIAAGTITTASTLTIKSDCDLSQLTYNYTGSSAGVRVGSTGAAFFRHELYLPYVVAAAKTVNGWAQVVGTVGVDVVNCYGTDIHVPYVKNFELGLQLRGSTSNGTQQTSIYLGHLDNSKVNMRFTGDATGWANQNYVFGGRMSHNSNEGVQVSGVRHVVFDNLANPINANMFYGTSMESPDVVEYHVEANNTQWNTMYGSRFENTGGDTHRRFLVTGNSKYNRLVGGAYAENVTQVVTSPALPWDISSSALTTQHGGTSTMPVQLLENVNSSSAPITTFMAAGAGTAGTDPTTGYTAQFTANTWKGKRSTDSFNRVELDTQNSQLKFGDGTAAPTGFFGGTASALTIGGGFPLTPLTNNSQDCGLSSLKWRYLRTGTGVQVGGFATASRPSAATAGAYTMIWDTTLNKPIWSDGTNWRDATGTVV